MDHRNNFLITMLLRKIFPRLSFVLALLVFSVKLHGQDNSLLPSCSLEVTVDNKTSSLVGTLVVDFQTKGEFEIQDNVSVKEVLVTPKVKKRKKLYRVDKGYRMNINFTGSFSSEDLGKPNLRNIVAEHEISLGENWYPQLIDKKGNTQECFYTLRAKIPPLYNAVSQTTNFNKITNEKNTLFTFRYEQPVQNIHLYASDFYVITKEIVSFSSTQLELEMRLFQNHAHLAKTYLQQLKLYAKRYFKLFGFFPYERFVVTESSVAFNTSLPTLFVVGKNNFPSVSLASAFVQQWLGNYVKTASALGNWASSLTYYLTEFSFAQEQSFATKHRKELLYNYQTAIGKKDERSVLDFKAKEDSANDFFIDTKAAMIFYLAEQKMGTKNFYKAVTEFTKNYGKKSATWQQLVDSFNGYSPGIAASLFWPWLSSKGLIDAEFKEKSLSYYKGVYQFIIEMNRQNQTPDTYVSFPATILSQEKKTSVQLNSDMLADELEEEFTFTATTLPQRIMIDPLYQLPRYLSEKEYTSLQKQFSLLSKENNTQQDITQNGTEVKIFEPKMRDTFGDLSFQEVIQKIANKKIICIGEQHNEFSHHLTQLRVIQELFKAGKKIIIGMEMFPLESQAAIDRYILGNNSEEQFLLESKYYDVWGFPYDLYKPIFDYAKEKRIPIKALNIDRNVIHAVAVNGLEYLPSDIRRKLPAQIDLTNEEYKDTLKKFFSMAHGKHSQTKNDTQQEEIFERFFQAQVSWDETMAEQSVLALKKNRSATLVVLAGSGHLQNGYGIPDRIQRRSGIRPIVLLPKPPDKKVSLTADYHYQISDIRVEPIVEKTLGVYLQKNIQGKLAVKKFQEFSPLYQAGFQEGDVIEKINDKLVTELFVLKTYLYLQTREDEMKILITRDGIPMLFYVRLDD